MDIERLGGKDSYTLDRVESPATVEVLYELLFLLYKMTGLTPRLMRREGTIRRSSMTMILLPR